MGTGTIAVIVTVAIMVIAAVIVLLSVRARRQKAVARHHIGLPELGSLSKAADQTEGGVGHEKAEESHS